MVKKSISNENLNHNWAGVLYGLWDFLDEINKLVTVKYLSKQPSSQSWKPVHRQGSINPLHWRHNDHDGVSNRQPHGCLLNRLFRRISKKTSKLRVTGLSVGNSPGPVNSPLKGPVTRKMFPFDDIIMQRKGTLLSYLKITYLSFVDTTND